MKIRCGFVSNSSSSSFMIYGGAFHGSENLFEELGLEIPVQNRDDSDVEYHSAMRDEIEKLATKHKLDVLWDYEQDAYYIGISLDKIHDDETGKKFKEKIQKSFKKMFGKDIGCDFICEEMQT